MQTNVETRLSRINRLQQMQKRIFEQDAYIATEYGRQGSGEQRWDIIKFEKELEDFIFDELGDREALDLAKAQLCDAQARKTRESQRLRNELAALEADVDKRYQNVNRHKKELRNRNPERVREILEKEGFDKRFFGSHTDAISNKWNC